MLKFLAFGVMSAVKMTASPPGTRFDRAWWPGKLGDTGLLSAAGLHPAQARSERPAGRRTQRASWSGRLGHKLQLALLSTWNDDEC